MVARLCLKRQMPSPFRTPLRTYCHSADVMKIDHTYRFTRCWMTSLSVDNRARVERCAARVGAAADLDWRSGSPHPYPRLGCHRRAGQRETHSVVPCPRLGRRRAADTPAVAMTSQTRLRATDGHAECAVPLTTSARDPAALSSPYVRFRTVSLWTVSREYAANSASAPNQPITPTAVTTGQILRRWLEVKQTPSPRTCRSPQSAAGPR